MTKRGYYASLPSEEKARLNKLRRAKYATPEGRKAMMNGNFKWRYGISLDEKKALLRSQGNRCAICGSSTPGGVRDWHTDHDHETGRIRGILCHACNMTLGQSRENIDRLLACVAYLERNRSG